MATTLTTAANTHHGHCSTRSTGGGGDGFSSPSKKIKMEKEEEDTAHSTTTTAKSPEIRRKRPATSYVLGDVFQTMLPRQPPKSNLHAPPHFPVETDPIVLARRRKQIEYGKGTEEYRAYAEAVARDSRSPHHPRTPNMRRKYSRRAWDGLVKQWRKRLHFWRGGGVGEAVLLRRGGENTEEERGGVKIKEEEPETEVKIKVEKKTDDEEPPHVSVKVENESWSEQVDEEYYGEGEEFDRQQGEEDDDETDDHSDDDEEEDEDE